ncbi:NAD(P)-binding protein [Xylariaceae sp. FL0255]|nr:NAD(P)-binding protein [Xylariaceae sp. FL0255]
MVGSKDLEPSTAPFFPNVFVHNQFCASPVWPSKETDLSGHTAIITGSNIGLGYEAAQQLLRLKLSHLIMAIRSFERGQTAANLLRKKFPSAKIEVWLLDMASYESIQSFAKRVNAELKRIDIVILNAGLGRFEYYKIESTGHEECFQVNYLSTVFLAVLLLPILKVKGPPNKEPARLTITGAALALVAKLEKKDANPLFPALDESKEFVARDSYNDSKLLAHMFLWKLADYVSADDVIVNIADPAWVYGTRLGRDLDTKMIVRAILPMTRLVARSPKVGASCLVDAIINKGKESHGCFLMSWKIHPFNAFLYTPEGKVVTQRVWNETMAEFEFANLLGIIESMQKKQ